MADEINVISRTQKIVVEPVSRAVSVINAGPQGPPGTGGGGGPGGVDPDFVGGVNVTALTAETDFVGGKTVTDL